MVLILIGFIIGYAGAAVTFHVLMAVGVPMWAAAFVGFIVLSACVLVCGTLAASKVDDIL